GWLVAEGELRQRQAAIKRLEDGAHALSDCDVRFLLRTEVRRHEVGDQAQRLVRLRPPALFVELDQDHRIGDPIDEPWLDRLSDDLIAVDRAAAADLDPFALERVAP